MTSANQHLRVFVTGGAPTGAASVSAMASDTAGFLGADGAVVADFATAIATGSAQLVVKHADDVIEKGQLWVDGRDNILNTPATVAGVAEVAGVATVTVGGTVEPGDQYVIRLTVYDYGGVISNQDEVNFYGTYVAVAGDGLTQVTAGLTESLQKALDKAPVPIATVTDASPDITVTAELQPYVRAKFDGKQLNFSVSIASPEDAYAQGEYTTVPVYGTNTGKQVAVQEEFFAGYNEMYEDRHREWPASKEPNWYANTAAASYSAITIEGEHVRGGASPVYSRQTEVLYHTPV